MSNERNWTVLIIGGASGTGKSSIAYKIAKYYGVNVMEADDIHLAVEVVTTKDTYPAIHYWDKGPDWKAIGVEANVNWLISVSKEMLPVLKALVNRHLEDKVPLILEGDFIHPELAAAFDDSEVKIIYINEADKEQIIQNYLSREGGEPQQYRAEISIAYGKWLADSCKQNNIKIIEARPWDTALARAFKEIT